MASRIEEDLEGNLWITWLGAVTAVTKFDGERFVNYGPGDPSYAHKQDEHVPVEQIRTCEATLRAWLEGGLA